MKTFILAVLFATVSYCQIADSVAHGSREVSDTDVLEALILALDYLEYQGDFTLGYSTPAQSLRDAANRMEQKERDIDHINYIIEELRKRIERQGKL